MVELSDRGFGFVGSFNIIYNLLEFVTSFHPHQKIVVLVCVDALSLWRSFGLNIFYIGIELLAV